MRRNSKKKLTLAALMLAAALSLMSACGKNDSKNTAGSNAGETTKAETGDKSGDTSVTPGEDLPGGEEAVKGADTEENKENAEASVTEAADKEGNETYMKKCEALLENEIPGEIMTKRTDEIEYPAFEKYYYYSSTAERDTPVNVLLPLGYSESEEYPVLYILHGYYDNEEWMARDNVNLSVMLNNLVADGLAKKMIVVLPYIYCSKDMQYCTGMDTVNTLNYDNFINDCLTDLMPFIEKTFSVAKGRENTAITGFSMGARESLFIGFSHPELFGYIGGVCAAPGLTEGTGYPWQLKTDELSFKEGEEPYVLLLSAAKGDGVVGNNPATYDALMTKNGVDHIWHEMTGTGHDASSVKPHLYNFFRMLFGAAETEE